MLCSRLTVEFSPPWWVGTLERWEDDRYEVGRVVFGAEPTEPEVLLWVLHRAVPAAHHSGDGSACPPSQRHRTPSGGSVRLPGSSSVRPERRPGQLRQRDREAEKQTRRQQTAEERREAAREQYRLPPAEAAAEALGTLIPVFPAVHNTPAGKIPAGVFFISCAKIYNPLLVPLPQNPYDNRGTLIKRKGSPWQSIIPMPPDACPCPGGKS